MTGRRVWGIVGALVALSLIGVGAFAIWRYTGDAKQRLIGTWQGTGAVTTDFGFESELGSSKDRVNMDVDMELRLLANGDYQWFEHHRTKGMWLTLSGPKEGGAPPKWDIVRNEAGRLALRLHWGDMPITFRGRDSFQLRFPTESETDGVLTFTRVKP